MAYVGDELPKPFSNLTEKSYVPLAIGFWDSSFRFWSRYIGRNSNL